MRQWEWVLVPGRKKRGGIGSLRASVPGGKENLGLPVESGEGSLLLTVYPLPRPTHPGSQNHLGGLYAYALGRQQERWLVDVFAFLLWRKPRTRTRRGLEVRNKG